MKILPSDNSYTTFCTITTGYRMFRVIEEMVRSGIVKQVEAGACTSAELVDTVGLRAEEGARFVAVLIATGLLEEYDGRLFLSRFSRTFLTRTSTTEQRSVLAFEPLLMENWERLGEVLRNGQGALVTEQSPEEYQRRLSLFQAAMGEAATVRSRELWDSITNLAAEGTIIDIGAGDGSYLLEFLARHPGWRAVACDLPDVCAAAATDDATTVTWHPCNILDSTALTALLDHHRGTTDLLLLSNLVHCYSPEENRAILRQAVDLLSPDGLLLVHDFYRDTSAFGALYDLHMLVNTWNGRSYATSEIVEMLHEAGLPHCTTQELPSGSLALVASRTTAYPAATSLFALKRYARTHGFFAAVELDPASIRSEAWVRAKCAYGCNQYGRRWSCPPHSLDQAGFEALLGEYSRALLVAGQPPLRDFQEHLLGLEREAFLGGFKKALVFSGGPCCWCETCPPEGCAFPEKRRPSLESCGCDVFALAERYGLPVTQLKYSDDFVQYIGLLLVE